ncbi:MAG: hypothetical protein AB8G17_21010 [Gammaproteobacteria bacterium]
MPEQRSHRTNRAQAVKWLVLVALLWAQVGFADHQFDHDEPMDDDCRICLQQDRDDVVVDVSLRGAVPVASSRFSCFLPPSANLLPPTFYNARASP